MKKWIVGVQDASKVSELKNKTDLSQLAIDVLVSRGIDNLERAKTFFADDDILSDPFFIRDMSIAADIINGAVDEGKLICIYGDYDCDGITATAMLYSYLECVGANVIYYIPERDEGYGMNCDAIQKLSNLGVGLVITVDNGIAAIYEAKLIRELGIMLVITDHHQPSSTLPIADAIVNPHRLDCTSPFKDLCGAGVVLKLLAALDGGSFESALEQFGDLTAIGTVADVVPIVGENRFIVKNGLRLIANTENLGLSALIRSAGLDRDNITSTDISYIIAPRINASGRFGSAMTAVKLLLTDDEDEADVLASELLKLNTERKSVEEKILNDIYKIIDDNSGILNERVLVFCGEGWHHGVIGIISARIVEKFGKPTIIVTTNGEESRGSARSGVDEFSIFQCLSDCRDMLERFGGHKGAGGFSMKTSNLQTFKDRVAEFALKYFPTMPPACVHAIKTLSPSELTVKAIEGLNVLEPFGEGNLRPTFAVMNATVNNVASLSNGKHTKLMLLISKDTSIQLPVLLFGVPPNRFFLKTGEQGDFIVQLELNTYNGKTTISSRLVDYRKSGVNWDRYFSAKEAYEKYMLGEGVLPQLKSRIVPTREELIAVYKTIAKDGINIDNLFGMLRTTDINYCKLRLCIDIFCELGLVIFMASESTVRLANVTKKVDLYSSKILSTLKL